MFGKRVFSRATWSEWMFVYKPIIFFPLTFFIFLLFIGLERGDSSLILGEKISNPLIPQVSPAPYPVKIGESLAPFVSAKAVVLVDSGTKKILHEKNGKVRFSPASTVKIMTALVSLEHYTFSDILTVKTEVGIPSTMGLVEGERISFESLLYGLLLNSGNDSARALSESYPGGRAAFIARMNDKTGELYLLDTHFADETGLDDDGNFTTALDLARLATEAIENPTLSKIVSVRTIEVWDESGRISHILENLNKLLGIGGINGVKTGTTKAAGEVLVASATRDGHTIVSVVLGSQDRFSESRRLIDWAFSSYQFVPPSRLSMNRE